MVIESLISNKKNLFWTIFHIVLGFVCTITPFALIGWFYFIFFTNINKSLNLLRQKKAIFFITLFSYLISFEVLDRMAKTSPYVPYELGKYFLVLTGILGIVFLGIRSQKGIFMAVLVSPAVFYDFSHERQFFDIINYYLAPLAIGLGIAYADRLKISEIHLNNILKLIWMTSLSCLIYTFIKTPDFEDITFNLGANFDTTGGHSSNQVSTILGLGMFLSFYSIYYKVKFSGNRILEILILAGFTFQGLLSFSRGGMLVGVFGILLLIFIPRSNQTSKLNRNSIFMIIISIFLLFLTFQFANKLTNGNLLLRYQGETQGTLLGTKEKSADQFVTGRLGILEKDLGLWSKNFQNLMLGVGCGSSPYLRDDNGIKVAAHVEFSRMLAEHGILGLIYLCCLFPLPFIYWRQNLNQENRNILFILSLIALVTTFHAAMRTFVTPLFLIIGSFSSYTKKNSVENPIRRRN